jgi:hypothetical protein
MSFSSKRALVDTVLIIDLTGDEPIFIYEKKIRSDDAAEEEDIVDDLVDTTSIHTVPQSEWCNSPILDGLEDILAHEAPLLFKVNSSNEMIY